MSQYKVRLNIGIGFAEEYTETRSGLTERAGDAGKPEHMKRPELCR